MMGNGFFIQHFSDKILLSKTISFPDLRKDGFTLIEIIIVLMVLAICASMMISFFGGTFLNSTTPYMITREQFNSDPTDPGLLESMEQIITDYNIAADKSAFQSSVSGSANYDEVLSAESFIVPGIANTGSTLTFTKVVVRKNDQNIMAFFPIF